MHSVSTGQQLAMRTLPVAPCALEVVLSCSLVAVGDRVGRVHIFTCDHHHGTLNLKTRMDPQPNRCSPVTGIVTRAW